MKDLRNILLSLLTVSLLTGCTQDELADGTQFAKGQYPLVINTASIGSPATRATADGTWDAGDIVCVQVINDYTNGQEIQWDTAAVLQYKVAADKVTLEYSEGKYKPFWTNKKQKLVRTWHCRNYSYPYDVLEKLPTEWNVQTIQDDYPNDNYPKYRRSDFVFAQKLATFNESIKNGVGLTFYHQVAKVVVNIYGQPLQAQNLKITDVYLCYATYSQPYSFTPPTSPDGIYGEWKNPTSGYRANIQMKPATANSNVNFGSETGTKNADFTFEALAIPQTTSSDYPLDIWIFVESDDGYDDIWSYEFTSPVTWEAGHVYTYNLNLTPSGLKLSSIDVSIGWATTGASDNVEVVL